MAPEITESPCPTKRKNLSHHQQFTRFNLAALLCVRQRPTLESLSGLVLVAAKYILVLREPMKEGAKGEDAGLAL